MLSSPKNRQISRDPSTDPAPATGSEQIRVVGLGKTYRTRGRANTAFRDVNLTVGKGELMCLLGPSGCGKSTLLNVLAGILPYDEGVAEIDGRPITGPSAERGMIFQSPMLFPWLTVRQNVAFGPKAQRRRGTRFRTVEREIDDLLATVGLGDFGLAYPKELSGGMQHRVAFARTIVSHPSIVLMDEPFAALDALTRASMQAFLLEMWTRFAITIVFVTHDIEEAILLGDRVCVMGGKPPRIIADIEVELRRPRVPADLDTSAFIDVKRRIRAILNSDASAQPDRAPTIRTSSCDEGTS